MTSTDDDVIVLGPFCQAYGLGEHAAAAKDLLGRTMEPS